MYEEIAAALELLYHKYYIFLFQTAQGQACNAEMAEEIVQQLFAKQWLNLSLLFTFFRTYEGTSSGCGKISLLITQKCRQPIPETTTTIQHNFCNHEHTKRNSLIPVCYTTDTNKNSQNATAQTADFPAGENGKDQL